MLGKLVNGRFISPSFEERTKIVISNPTDEHLKNIYGYVDVFENEEPPYDEETQILNPIYTENENGITVDWEVCEIENEE